MCTHGTAHKQVIDAEVARRKMLEDCPIPSVSEDPVLFDTAEIPWWAWVRRFHLPEVNDALLIQSTLHRSELLCAAAMLCLHCWCVLHAAVTCDAGVCVYGHVACPYGHAACVCMKQPAARHQHAKHPATTQLSHSTMLHAPCCVAHHSSCYIAM